MHTTSRGRVLLAAALATLIAAGSPGALAAEKPAKLYEDALARYEKNDVAGAHVQVKNALQQDPKMLAGFLLLGKIELGRGDNAAAEDAFARALQLGLDRSEVALPLSRALFGQGKHQALLERFPAEAAAPSQRAELLVLRGRAQRALGDKAAAAKSFEDARAADPRLAAVPLAQAELFLEQGRRADAARAADEATALAPNDARTWNLKGAIALAGGDVAGALSAYDEAVGVDAKNVDARIARVTLLVGLGREAQAEQDVAFLKRERPTDPRANYARALYLAKRGDQAGAREALHAVTRAIDPAPRDVLMAQAAELLLLAGTAHFDLGQIEKARTYLTDYLRIHPQHGGARKLLGSVFLTQGDPRTAITTIEPVVKQTPNDTQALALLAAAYMARRQYEMAAGYLEQALKASGSAADVHATLGLSFAASGRQDIGIDHLRQALKKDPGQARAGVPLAVLLLKRGQAKEAVEIAQAIVGREPKNVAALNLLGVARAAAGDPKGARTAYEQALAADRTLLAAQLNLSRLDAAQGDYAAARTRLEAIVRDQPKNTRAMFELAGVEQGAKRTPEAIRWLEKARAIDRRDAAIAAQLVDLLIANRQLEQALTVAKEAEAAAPDNVIALGALGRVQLALGDLRNAQTTFGRMARLVAFDPAWLTEVARYQLAANDAKGAAYSLEKALTARPDFLPAQVLMAEIELAGGETAKAEQRAKTIVSRAPDRAVGHRLLADAALARKQYPEAVSGYRTALAKEENVDGAIRLYRAYIESGSAQKALEVMETWVRAHPLDAVALRALAEAHLRTGNLAQARIAYEQVLELTGEDPVLLNNLANILLRLGDRKGAVEYAERARRLAPNDAAIQDTLGWALVEHGDLDQGLRHLREARLRDPRNPEIRYHLAFALSRAGRKDEARQELEPVLGADVAFEAKGDAQALWKSLAAR
jgi:putative PEP-CTERM system TPR-repeat lipoprotein